MLEDVYKNAPKLPENARETLVNITPWIALIFGVLGVLAGISLVGVSPLGMFGGVHNTTMLLVSGVASVVASVMMLMAYPKLQKRLMGGWVLLFWSEVVNIASSLLTLSVSNVISTVIWAAIAFYILFQIKSHYK
jgi:hypothetical protein